MESSPDNFGVYREATIKNQTLLLQKNVFDLKHDNELQEHLLNKMKHTTHSSGTEKFAKQ